MTKSYVKFVLLATLLAILTTSSAVFATSVGEQDDYKKEDRITDFPVGSEFTYLPGTWATEYEMPEYGQMREELIFAVNDENPEKLDVVMHIFVEGKEIDQAIGYMVLDKKTNKIKQYSTTTNNSITANAFELEREGTNVLFEGKSNSPGMEEFRVKFSFTAKNHYDFAVIMKDDSGNWVETMKVKYSRVIQ